MHGSLAVASFAILSAVLLPCTGCGPSSTTPGGAPATGTTGSSTGTAAGAGAGTPSAAVPSTAAATAAPSAEPTSFTPGAPWPRLVLEKRFERLSEPLYVTATAADPGRLFLVQKGGVVRSARAGALERSAFLDVSDRVSTGGEQGLLCIAFPPGAAALARVYACYTDDTGDVVITRFGVSGGVAQAASGEEVLRVGHRAHPNHNGGQLAFGPDGMLYAGIGDGGGEGDPNGNGQDLGVLLAKILRLDVEGVESSGGVPPTYLVPRVGPFASRPRARPETWVWGLRNPWRFSFDAATGDLYIGDVGQDAWEEIDLVPAGSRGGQDFGWSVMEGFHPYRGSATAALTPPIAEYGHDLGDAVTGGYVYRGERYPVLRGVYLFGDYGSGRIWGLRREGGAWRTRELLRTPYAISSFGEDAARELYLTDIAGGAVYQVTAR